MGWARGIGSFITDGSDSATRAARMMIDVLGSLAEYERELIKDALLKVHYLKRSADGIISPAHNTFRDHAQKGLRAPLNPVSQGATARKDPTRFMDGGPRSPDKVVARK
jgi:hypothetical protein